LRLELPRIYPITDTRLSGLSHTDQVARLLDGGAKFIQLREKSLSPADFLADALQAVRLAHARGARIIINDRVDIAIAVEADGVHAGQDDLPPAEVRRLLGPHAIVGFSTHTREQAATAALLPIDYLAFGPLFPTNTKENADPVVGVTELFEIRKLVTALPLVAIGGINDRNVADVILSGADSAAVISALYSDPSKIAETHGRLLNSVVTL
jgi:thiamine-phosphate pyrophosphorylase